MRWSVLVVALSALVAVTAVACGGVEKPNPTTGGTVKLKYGPYHVPDMNSPGTGTFAAFAPMLGAQVEKGMLWNQPDTDIRKPCDNCYITGMQAGLEYTDGTNANINTGMWLHHMVLINQGTGRSDPTCANSSFSLPHFAVGTTPTNSERFFASGNERTGITDVGGMGYGYKVNQGDKFHALVDLMNMNTTAKDVYLTVEYAYRPASENLKPVKPVWLDAAQCGTSEVRAQTGAYTVSSVPWRTTVTGRLLLGGTHLHDGGTHATIEVNGQVWCDSKTLYGTKPEYIEPGGSMPGMDHTGGGMMHISEQPLCAMGPTLNAGDSLTVRGFYDDSQHAQMTDSGHLDDVMSIAILYIG